MYLCRVEKSYENENFDLTRHSNVHSELEDDDTAAAHWDLLEILVWKFKRGNQLVL